MAHASNFEASSDRKRTDRISVRPWTNADVLELILEGLGFRKRPRLRPIPLTLARGVTPPRRDAPSAQSARSALWRRLLIANPESIEE
jgi:hypothetical protein